MNPGELTQRIEIIDPFATKLNELGEYEDTPVTVCKVWAKVVGKGGREFIEAQKITPESRYVVTIRYRDDIYEDMIIKWRDKTLQITNVFDFKSRNEFLEIQCYQKGVQGRGN